MYATSFMCTSQTHSCSVLLIHFYLFSVSSPLNPLFTRLAHNSNLFTSHLSTYLHSWLLHDLMVSPFSKFRFSASVFLFFRVREGKERVAFQILWCFTCFFSKQMYPSFNYKAVIDKQYLFCLYAKLVTYF